jgi:peptidoglycan/xylan/chitin deacetylase (PgdA/CDA1 family)
LKDKKTKTKKFEKKSLYSDKDRRLDGLLVRHTRIIMWSLVGILLVVLMLVVSSTEARGTKSSIIESANSLNDKVFTAPKPYSIPKAVIPPKPLLQGVNLEKKPFNKEVPILMYHYIEPVQPNADSVRRGLTVAPETFRKQMKWLKDNGYATVTASKYFDAIVKGEKMSDKTVLITFDDGYKDIYQHAIPILREYGQTATMFIIARRNGAEYPEYMNQDEIRDIDTWGFEIGSHSLTHPNLVNLGLEMAKGEIQGSKEDLEKIIGHTVNFFCYPLGKYNSDTVNLVREVGYKGAFTTETGVVVSNNNVFRMPRLRMTETINIEGFVSKLK